MRIGDVNVVIRQGRWKGIWNDEPQSLELYDLTSDPREASNLSTDQVDRARSLSTQAKGWLETCKKNRVTVPRKNLDLIDEAARERLRALGYIR